MVATLKVAALVYGPLPFSKACKVSYCVADIESIISIWVSHELLAIFQRRKFPKNEETFAAAVAGVAVKLEANIFRIIAEFLHCVSESIVVEIA